MDLGEILDHGQMSLVTSQPLHFLPPITRFIFPQVFSFVLIVSFATSFARTIHFVPMQSANYGVSRGEFFLAAGYKSIQMAVEPWAIRFVDLHRTHRHDSVQTEIYYTC